MTGYENVHDHFNPTDGDDWAPAFARAIAAAKDTNRGVFVPAAAEDYTVRKPGPKLPSIDLRGLTDFRLVGEGDGSRIRMLGSGGGGSWNMIMIGGNSTGVTVQGLYLDGDADHLTDLDDGQHTHTIQVGGMISGGFAHRSRILDCTMTDMDGDGVAIAALDGAFGAGNEVSGVDIIGCRFVGCRRTGVSNQRAAELVRIVNCHFEGILRQDIDFEPSGTELGTGCRRYAIVGNTFVHSSGSPAVTLSGLSGDNPARQNTFALNHVHGGRIGMINAQDTLLLGNHVESGPDQEPVLRISGRSDGVRVSHNTFIRAAGAPNGKTIAVSGDASALAIQSSDPATATLTTTKPHRRATGTGPVTLTSTGTLPTGLAENTDYWLIRVDPGSLRLAASFDDALDEVAVAFSDTGTGKHTVKVFDHPRGVDFNDNRVYSYTGTDGDNCAVLVTNAAESCFTNNEVSSYFAGEIANAVCMLTNPNLRPATRDWDVSRNRITGNAANNGGSYTYGITLAAGGVAVSGVRVNDNAFRDCTNHTRWKVDGGGQFTEPPTAIGNTGDGTDFVGLNALPAICIGGNSKSQADYVYDNNNAADQPPFIAATGSTARRRSGGGIGTTFYVREANTWVGK